MWLAPYANSYTFAVFSVAFTMNFACNPSFFVFALHVVYTLSYPASAVLTFANDLHLAEPLFWPIL